MATINNLFPLVKNDIDADSILAEAMKVISQCSGKVWTDTDIHDPGVTMLEALAYAISDLAYRHTRSFSDLITPPIEYQLDGGGIFPVEFGPQQALTCGPITVDDYRRALLDLHSSDEDDGYFLFSNVSLVREPESQRYQYWHNADEREYSFNYPGDAAPNITRLTLLGNYHLYLLPSHETEKNPQAAINILNDFLQKNRNLGEAVSNIIWLTPEEVPLQMVIDVDDNIGTQSNIASILAEIYKASCDYIIPPVVRKSTAQLYEQGWDSEDVYDGPYLHHGWIPELPPEIDLTTPKTLNLSGLVSNLLDIPGVKGIRYLGYSSTSQNQWQWVASDILNYPRLWGKNPLATLTDGVTVKLLAKGDITLSATVDDVRNELHPRTLIQNSSHKLPYGRWRNPGRVYPATNLLPPCYKMRVPVETLQQEQLHQFMLIFEQLLADGCQQLALLPFLLTFKQRGSEVWGRQWPFSVGTVSDSVHDSYREQLLSILKKSKYDRAQALAVTDFLLSYFNAKLAPEIFKQSAESFLSSQQGYLSRHTELVYHRANATHGWISSLQRRIAARLGLGGADIFEDKMPLNRLPFYLIEHRALLPVQPNPRYVLPQMIDSVVTERLHDMDCLTFFCSNVAGLKVGMVIDVLLDSGTHNEFTIRAQVITAVDYYKNSFSLSMAASASLRRNTDEILSAKQNSLTWKNSDVWLEEIGFKLTYSNDQSGLTPAEKRLSCSPFPVMVNVEDELLLEYRINPLSNYSTKHDFSQRLKVLSVDRIANTLVVTSDDPLPLDDSSQSYYWHLPVSYATQDRFSFMVSAVFEQDFLFNSSTDPYATEAWVRDVILSEIPSHLGMLLHWKPKQEFEQFADTYSQWQRGNAILGDKSYDLMSMLALGKVPDALEGIGAMYVATPEKRDWVVGADGNEWNSDVIIEEQLFYVPSVPGKDDPSS